MSSTLVNNLIVTFLSLCCLLESIALYRLTNKINDLQSDIEFLHELTVLQTRLSVESVLKSKIEPSPSNDEANRSESSRFESDPQQKGV